MRNCRYISIAELRHRMCWKGFTHHDIKAVSDIIDNMPDAWGDPDDPPEDTEVIGWMELPSVRSLL